MRTSSSLLPWTSSAIGSNPVEYRYPSLVRILMQLWPQTLYLQIADTQNIHNFLEILLFINNNLEIIGKGLGLGAYLHMAFIH